MWQPSSAGGWARVPWNEHREYRVSEDKLCWWEVYNFFRDKHLSTPQAGSRGSAPTENFAKSKSPSTHPHELTTLLFIPPGHSIFTDALQNLHKPSYFLHLSSLRHYSLLNCFLSYDSRSHKHTVNAFTKPYEHTTKVRSTTLSSYRHLIYAQPATNYTMCIW